MRDSLDPVRLTLDRDRLTVVTYAQLGLFGYWIYGFGPVVPLLLKRACPDSVRW